MAYLRRSAAWSDPRVKPPYGVAEIDWTHPLAAGLVACWLFNEGGGDRLHDMARHRDTVITTPTQVTWAGTTSGLGLSSAAHAGTTIGATITPGLAVGASTVAWSWEARCAFTVAGDDYATLLVTAAGDAGLYFRPTFGLLSLYSLLGDHLNATAVAAGTRHHWVVTVATSNGAFYLDGVVDRTFGEAGGANLGPYTFGAMFNDIFSDTFDGTCDFMRVWDDKTLSAENAAWLANEPFVMFRPIVRRRYFMPAAVPIAATIWSNPIVRPRLRAY